MRIVPAGQKLQIPSNATVLRDINHTLRDINHTIQICCVKWERQKIYIDSRVMAALVKTDMTNGASSPGWMVVGTIV